MRESFSALDTLRPSDLRAEVARRMEQPLRPLPDANGAGRRLIAAAVAAAVFAGAALFAWTMWGRVSEPTPAPATDPWGWAPDGWTALPAPPVAPGGEAWLWAGDRLLAWGGCAEGDVDACVPSPDGWSFDPAAHRWEPMPRAPLDGAYATAVWTGREAFFLGLGERGRGGQAFDPATGSWREIRGRPRRRLRAPGRVVDR